MTEMSEKSLSTLIELLEKDSRLASRLNTVTYMTQALGSIPDKDYDRVMDLVKEGKKK